MGRRERCIRYGILLCMMILLMAQTAWAESDALRISYYDNYPLCFQDENGEPQGVFVDVLNEVADGEGWELIYEFHSFEDQMKLVFEGKVDLGLAVADTKDRAELALFPLETIYSNWGQVFVADHLTSVDTYDSLSKYRVAVVRGDIYAKELEDSFAFLGLENHFVYMDSFTDVFAAIEGGEAEAGAVARTFGLLYQESYAVKATTLAIRSAKVKVIGAQGSESLLAAVDRWIAGMRDDPNSRYYKILSRWLRDEVNEEVFPDWLKWILGLAALTGVLSLSFAFFLQKMVAKQTKELRYLAHHDPLTGLPNRSYMRKMVDGGEWEKPADFLLIDLDQFRRINDVYGHEMGDRLLVSLTDLVKKHLPDSAVLSRLSGDEFTILLPRFQGEDFANRLLELIQSPLEVREESFQIGMSMGLAKLPEDGTDYDTLTKKAEMAMYQAKGKGKEKVQWFRAELEARLHETHWYLRYLREAIAKEELYLAYQPIVDAHTESMVGVEALLRWKHEGKLISPGLFIPIAEQTGLIHEIGDWVVGEAVRQLIAWQKKSQAPRFMSVNLSAVQLNQSGFVDHLDEMVGSFGVEKSKIHFEVTENAEIEKIGNSRRALEILKERGYRISLDDFGMGYSSMNYLKELPIDTMKIDRSFVQEIGQDRETEIMIEELLILANRMNLMTIAEGVETQAQWHFLREHGCRMIQGYYFGRPVKAEELFR